MENTHTFRSRGALLACIGLAVATTALSVMMAGEMSPGSAPMAEGFRTPMLAFELARTEADLAFLEGNGAEPLRAELEHMQQLDAYFPFVYAGMLASLFLGLALAGRRVAWLGLVVALVVIPADLAENHFLDSMLRELAAGGAVGPLLDGLIASTSVKWGLIATSAGLFAHLMLGQRSFGRAVIGAATAVGWWLVLLLGAPGILAEIAGILLFLFFVGVPFSAIVELRRASSAPPQRRD